MSVHADPAKLRELAGRLRNAGQQMQQLQRQAMGALQSSGWNDNERVKFEGELSRDLKTVAAVGQRLQSEYTKTLQRKAQALDDFQR